MIITVKLRDGRTMKMEAQGKDRASLADFAAAQTDDHRGYHWKLVRGKGGVYTLKRGKKR